MLSETGKSIWRNKFSSLLSAVTTGFALFLLGISFLIGVNLEFIFQTVEAQMEIQAYLKKDVQKGEVSRTIEQVKKIQGVTEVKYISKEDALEELKAMFGDKASILDGLGGENPLPASIRVKTDGVEEIENVASELNKMDVVDEVIFQKEISRRLSSIGRAIQYVSYGGVIIVGLVAVMVIGNSIRLTINSRRHEISIMKLVGATDGFIVGPFLLEGVVLGVMGSILGALFAVLLYLWIFKSLLTLMPFLPLFRLDVKVAGDMLGIMLITGIAVGITGSVFSLRRYLNV